MDDVEFLDRFETARLHEFKHADHIRMAYLYLRRAGWEEGTYRIRRGLQHFAAAHHQPTRYHETITLFWGQLVYHAMHAIDGVGGYEDLIRAHPSLLDTTLIERHYSRDRLMSEDACARWVEPDRRPLPDRHRRF